MKQGDASKTMSKRARILICAVLVATIGLVTWWALTPDEPSYQGKTLSRWLEGHVPTSAANPPYNSPGWHEAEKAIRHIGTNGIPTLLRMIRAKDPPKALLKIIWFARTRQSLIPVHYRYASSRNEEAEYAFQLLGATASNAVPGLIEIYQHNVSASSQRCAALALGHIGKPAQAALLVLLADFASTNGEIRFYAVSAVDHIGGKPEIVIPAMKKMLKDSEPWVRWNASDALGNFGGRAREAVPDLLAAIDDPISRNHPGLRQQLEYVVWHIAPEKIGDPLIVEANTPLVVNGVTAGTIDFAFNGERRTLIWPGRRVPCLTQFWAGEPRGIFTVYRNEGNSSATNHFLGDFEVSGLPPTNTSVNVSVLCMVADQQILISARDNIGKEFLKVRRVR